MCSLDSGSRAVAFPMYDMIEYQLVKHNLPNGGLARVLYRLLFVVLTAFVAITIPFFGSLLVSHLHSNSNLDFDV